MIHPDASPYLQPNLDAHKRKWNIAPAIGADDAFADSHWIELHGANPLADAAAWLDRATADRAVPDTICVIGAGLGYVVDVIATRWQSRILVLETEPAFAPWFFARRDWRELIDSGRLLVLTGPHFDGSQIAWRLFGDGASEPLLLAHPILGRARPDATRLAAQVIGRAKTGAAGNEEARRKFAAPYLVNTLRNVPVIAQASPVDALAGRYRGRPIVMAAAGPSLNRNIEELRPFRDRVVLLAVDTALKPLLSANMAPDFVVALDPSDANARHLTGVTVPESTALVAEPSIAPSSFTAFGDRVFIFRVAEHAPWPWLRKMGLDCGLLRAWGSVVTSTFDLALRMGGDPIVFIGTDLAYTSGQPYARGTTYEEDWLITAGPDRPIEWVWEQVVARKGVTADGLDGAAAVSAKGLIVFRDWLVEDSKRPERPRLINATGAGILHGGRFEQRSIADLAAEFSGPLALGSGLSVLGSGLSVLGSGLSALGTRPSNPRTLAPSNLSPLAPSNPLEPSHLHTLAPAPTHPRPLAPSNPQPLAPQDLHVFLVLQHPPPPLVAPASDGVPPYRLRSRKMRIAGTRRIRAERANDLERWSNPSNFDRAWELGPAHAGRLVPPGSRVLDLGAGLEALAGYIPAGCDYTPADLVRLSPRTVVVDLNCGVLPSGDFDVAAMLGVLEFIHDVPRVLAAARRRVPLAIATYCARTSDDPETRLERGFVNDFTRNEFVLLCQKAGWQVVYAERLVVTPGFDQWMVALRT